MKKKHNDDVVLFVGTMNAMPMMYAAELRKMGFNVVYIVDRPKKDTLCRPENHFPDIKYPYPDWVIEFVLPSQILVALFPGLILRLIKRKANIASCKAVFASGFFIRLLSLLEKKTSKIALSYGSDLDSWCDIERLNYLQVGMRGRSIFRFIPNVIANKLIKKIVQSNIYSLGQSNCVMYFPRGFNERGDKIIDSLPESVKYIPRYDVSFSPLTGASRKFRSSGEKLILLCPVRFLYKSFPEGNAGYNKGNDKIIRGIAKYKQLNPSIEIHFFEKGEDVDAAKILCKEMAIDDVVVWHKEMKMLDLLSLYEKADIVFDQVGEHWIGAVGIYALYLGKPLIANCSPAIRSAIWPKNNPVCNVEDEDDIVFWLKRLEREEFRFEIHQRSKIFSEQYCGPRICIDRLIEFGVV